MSGFNRGPKGPGEESSSGIKSSSVVDPRQILTAERTSILGRIKGILTGETRRQKRRAAEEAVEARGEQKNRMMQMKNQTRPGDNANPEPVIAPITEFQALPDSYDGDLMKGLLHDSVGVELTEASRVAPDSGPEYVKRYLPESKSPDDGFDNIERMKGLIDSVGEQAVRVSSTSPEEAEVETRLSADLDNIPGVPKYYEEPPVPHLTGFQAQGGDTVLNRIQNAMQRKGDTKSPGENRRVSHSSKIPKGSNPDTDARLSGQAKELLKQGLDEAPIGFASRSPKEEGTKRTIKQGERTYVVSSKK